jgi:hypothetical protein
MTNPSTEAKAIEQDHQAWLQGYRAGQLGRSWRDGLYPPGSTEAWAWSSGYIEGKAAQSPGGLPLSIVTG